MDLTPALAFSTSIAFLVFYPGNELGRGDRMFEMLLSDPLEKSATATATVADKRCLIQDVISDMNQPRILCPLQGIQQFIYRSSFPESLLRHKIGGRP
jgi:hypothetical protein